MGTIDIDYGSLGVGLLLMLIPVYFLWRFKTGLLKPVLIGTVRMIIQLFLIGAYLRFLFEWNNPFINFLWVIIMVGVAAETALTRTRLKRGILMIPISYSVLSASACTSLPLYYGWRMCSVPSILFRFLV